MRESREGREGVDERVERRPGRGGGGGGGGGLWAGRPKDQKPAFRVASNRHQTVLSWHTTSMLLCRIWNTSSRRQHTHQHLHTHAYHRDTRNHALYMHKCTSAPVVKPPFGTHLKGVVGIALLQCSCQTEFTLCNCYKYRGACCWGSGVLPHMYDHTHSHRRCCIIPMANALPGARSKGDEGIGVPAARAQGSIHEPLWLECLGIREVVGIMVHPQDVEGYLCASWQCVTSQLHCSFRFTNLQQQDNTVEHVQVSWKCLCRRAT